MKIVVGAKNIELTSSIEQYIGEKINGLSKLMRSYEEGGVVEARIEIARTTKHHKKGEIWSAEVNLILPNTVLRSESKNFDIFSAIDEVRDELAGQIKSYKGRQSLRRKRNARS